MPSLEDQNGLWLRRVYITYDSDISDKLKARARLELNSAGNFSTSAATLVPVLKDAYIAYQFAPLHKLTLGIQDSLSFSNIEKFYGYRHLEKTPFDLYKVRSSRDFALCLSGAFDTAKKFNYSVQYGNYSGNKSETDKYKQVGARLFVNVTPELMVEVNGDISTISAVKKSYTYQLFAGYKGDWGRVGVGYGSEIVQEDGKDDADFGLFSAFAVAKLGEQVRSRGPLRHERRPAAARPGRLPVHRKRLQDRPVHSRPGLEHPSQVPDHAQREDGVLQGKQRHQAGTATPTST